MLMVLGGVLREVNHVRMTNIYLMCPCRCGIWRGMKLLARIGAVCVLAIVVTTDCVAAEETVVLRLVDSDGKPVPDAVVYYEFADAKPAGPPERAVIEQKDIAFVPALTVIRTGTVVEFPNSDNVSHHVYSFVRPNAFELPLYTREVTPTVRFDHPGIVVLGCNIHDAMLGYIVVVDTPTFGMTDADGVVTLRDAPADADLFQVWSPRLDPAQPLQIEVRSSDRRASPVALHAGRKLRSSPRTGSGSLAWDDY